MEYISCTFLRNQSIGSFVQRLVLEPRVVNANKFVSNRKFMCDRLRIEIFTQSDSRTVRHKPTRDVSYRKIITSFFHIK